MQSKPFIWFFFLVFFCVAAQAQEKSTVKLRKVQLSNLSIPLPLTSSETCSPGDFNASILPFGASTTFPCPLSSAMFFWHRAIKRFTSTHVRIRETILVSHLATVLRHPNII